MLTYYFDVYAHFKKDIDVDAIEKEIGKKAYKKVSLKDSKGSAEHKCAKISFRTNESHDVYVGELFSQFVESTKSLFGVINKYLNDYEGTLTFCIVFTNFGENPSINLSNKTMSTLSDMGANFDIDFI